MLQFEVPYPVSVNRAWRRYGNRTIISREGRTYRKAVAAAIGGIVKEPISAAVAVDVQLFPPDKRRRDVDNALKTLLDALQHARVIADDSQVKKLSVEMLHCHPGGKAAVVIREL